MKIIKLPQHVLMPFAFGGVLLTQSAMMFSVEAEIFKCTNKQGAIYYNDKPCPVDNDEKKIQNEKDLINGYVPPKMKEEHIDKRKKGVVFREKNNRFIGDKTKEPKKTEESGDSSESKQGGSSSGVMPIDLGASNNEQKVGPVESVESRPPANFAGPKFSNKKVNGKFTIQQKRAMLGIVPADR